MQRLAPALFTALALLLPAAALAGPPAAAPAQAPVRARAGKSAVKPSPRASGARPAPRKAGKGEKAPGGPAHPDEAVRRSIAGGPTADEAGRGAEAPELRALREAEREIFAPAAPRPGTPWPDSAPFPLPIDPDRPVIHASGLPAEIEAREPVAAMLSQDRDLAWLQALKLPDLPVRWDARVVRYLQFFRDDPRGRSTAAYGWKRSGRYRDAVKAALRAEGVPESLLWVAMVESGFEPAIRSHAGAAGLWQFMPDGARIYGLRVDRWLDERLDPPQATSAAAKYLSDLHRRFGGWELALAAYNMGYGGLLSTIRKYNSNDFWELSRLEAALPWETTLYVPKIIALAVVAENPAVFGLLGVEPEAPLALDQVRASGGLSLEAMSRAAGVSAAELDAINPQLRARRTPPDAPQAAPAAYVVRVPAGKGERLAQALPELGAREPRLQRYTVRFGQTVEAIAQELGSSRGTLLELNGMSRDEFPRAGEILLVPENSRAGGKLGNERPVVVVPRSPRALPGKRRLFYRVIPGDALPAIAAAFRVAPADLMTWNSLDPAVRLQEGTSLQVFVDPAEDLSSVLALREEEASVLTVGSDEFFAWFEAQKGRRRIAVSVGPKDTWKTLSSRYALSLGMLERINHRSRAEPLRPGDTLLVYTGKAGEGQPAAPDEAEPSVTAPPHPEDLPPLPAAQAPETPALPTAALP